MRSVAAIAACLLSLLLATPAFAAPAQTTFVDLAKTLKLEPKPADYVVLVDTSGSMTQDGRFDKVRAALTSMLQALRPNDQVSLITFDEAATTVYEGTASDPAGIVAKLPAVPNGQLTDIGAGIDAGLKRLESGDAKRLGAIALITDGKVDAPGSPYADAASPAWAALKERATKLSGNREVAAYALSVINVTDAALLHQPFPNATDIPADQFSARLAALQGELLKFQAAEALRPDLQRGVTASFEGVDWAALKPGAEVTGSLKLSSTYQRIPVAVTGLKLTATGALPLTFGDLPAEVSLAPGAAADIPLTVKTGEAPAGSGASVSLAGNVESPWQTVLTQDLVLAFAPKVTASANAALPAQAAVPTPTPTTTNLPLPIVGAAIAGLAALILLFVLVRRARAPRLVGSLAVSRDGQLVREFLLDGRSASLADPATAGLSGTVTARRNEAGGPGVQLNASASGRRVKARLADGGVAEVGDYEISYTAQRTRMMSMIRAGLEEHRSTSSPTPHQHFGSPDKERTDSPFALHSRPFACICSGSKLNDSLSS